jgi:MerR family transcriptional regulator, heat shock protein HspR
MQSDETTPVYTISVAAQLSDLHPQTLRQYDRLGLVCPQRVNGRNRLYSERDVERLREIAELSAEGMSLVGVQRVLQLEAELERVRTHLDELLREKHSTALVLWNPRRRRRA